MSKLWNSINSSLPHSSLLEPIFGFDASENRKLDTAHRDHRHRTGSQHTMGLNYVLCCHF